MVNWLACCVCLNVGSIVHRPFGVREPLMMSLSLNVMSAWCLSKSALHPWSHSFPMDKREDFNAGKM